MLFGALSKFQFGFDACEIGIGLSVASREYSAWQFGYFLWFVGGGFGTGASSF